MLQKILTLIVTILIVASCKGQEKNKISDKDLQKLYEQEIRNEERAKYGNQKTKVKIISKTKEVEHLKKYIQKKNEERKLKELKELKNKTLTERYKAGDKSVIPQIIEILKSNNKEARKNIYLALNKSYDDPENYTIQDSELIKTIFDNINIIEDQKHIIQLAGYMKFPNYTHTFKYLLLSGKSENVNRLIYWLSQDGKSTKVLDFIEQLILEDDFDFNKYDYVMSGLEGFAENGNINAQKKVVEICLTIYHKNLIPNDNFVKMKNSWSSSNPAISLTNILFKYGDKRVIPIAHDFLKKEIDEEGALTALIRIEGETQKQLLFQYLKDKDKFFEGLYPAIKMYQLTHDDKIITTILLEFERRKEYPDYLVDRIVSTLIEMEPVGYFDKLDKVLHNKRLIKLLKESYELTKGSVQEIANDLFEFGVVDKPFSKEIIDKAKEQTEYDGSNGYIYNFLTVSGIYQWFDAETGFVPVDYDNLIKEFAKNSNGKLVTIDVWMDVAIDEDYKVDYKIYLSANERIYIVKPEDIGDWYDVDLILNLMNTVLSDSKLKERYIFIDTGDQTVQILFGPKDKVNLFAKKYKL